MGGFLCIVPIPFLFISLSKYSNESYASRLHFILPIMGLFDWLSKKEKTKVAEYIKDGSYNKDYEKYSIYNKYRYPDYRAYATIIGKDAELEYKKYGNITWQEYQDIIRMEKLPVKRSEEKTKEQLITAHSYYPAEGDLSSLLTMKECSKCYTRKPLNAFRTDTRLKSAHRSDCKACEVVRMQKNREKKKAVGKLNLELIPPHIALKGMGDGLNPAERFFEAKNNQPPLHFLKPGKEWTGVYNEEDFMYTKPGINYIPNKSIQQELLDILDDLDILQNRVSKLMANTNG